MKTFRQFVAEANALANAVNSTLLPALGAAISKAPAGGSPTNISTTIARSALKTVQQKKPAPPSGAGATITPPEDRNKQDPVNGQNRPT